LKNSGAGAGRERELIMQLNGVSRGIMPRNWAVPHQPPFLARFLGKVMLDVLPAALASVIGGFLFTQYQFGHAADDAATARAIADAQSSAEPAAEAPARVAAAVAVPKAAPRGKTPAGVASAVAPARAPLVIAQAEQSDAASTGRLARDPDSLLAKTLDIKDHVVGAARNVVSAIGDVIGTVGGHLIGANLETAPPTRQFSSAS